MATQKPGEWANTLITRFEEQVSNPLTTCNNENFYYLNCPPSNQYLHDS